MGWVGITAHKSRLIQDGRWGDFVKRRAQLYKAGWPRGQKTAEKLVLFYPPDDPTRKITDDEMRELCDGEIPEITHQERNNVLKRDENMAAKSAAKLTELAGTVKSRGMFDVVASPAPAPAPPKDVTKVVEEECRDGNTKVSWNDIVRWISDHAGADDAVTAREAPTKGAWVWLMEVRTNASVRQAFYTQIIPKLFTKESQAENVSFTDDAYDAKSAIRRCLAEAS